jgi:hypothetical protein
MCRADILPSRVDGFEHLAAAAPDAAGQGETGDETGSGEPGGEAVPVGTEKKSDTYAASGQQGNYYPRCLECPIMAFDCQVGRDRYSWQLHPLPGCFCEILILQSVFGVEGPGVLALPVCGITADGF